MDEPFDELMGPPAGAQMKRLSIEESNPPPPPPVVTPDSSLSSRSSAGPPSGAFSSAPPMGAFSNRWSQYEENQDELAKESAKATGSAIASAAHRAAERADYRDRMGSSGDTVEDEVDDYMVKSVQDRLTRGGNSLPHEDEIKTSASSRRTPRKWSFNTTGRKFRNEEETIELAENDRVRAEALRVLEMADSGGSTPSAVRRTRTGGFTSERVDPSSRASRRASEPDASPGAPFSFKRGSSFGSASSYDRKNRTSFTIDSDDEIDESALDVVTMESTLARATPMAAHDSSPTQANSSKSWSSRYSTPAPIVSSLNTSRYNSHSEFLDNMDKKEQDRLAQSARNMYSDSPYSKSSSSPKIFGSNFSFTGKQLFGTKKETPSQSDQVNLKTVWMDVDLDLQKDGKSMSPPSPDMYHRGPAAFEARRKKRNRCIWLTLVLIFSSILGGIVGSLAKRKEERANVPFSTLSAEDFGKYGVTFVVTGDTPHSSLSEVALQRSLAALADHVQFVIHLGNIQDASVTLCPEMSYIDAAGVFRASPVPVFVLPGPDDWNNCPQPSIAFGDWQRNLGRFDRQWDHNFAVDHQPVDTANFYIIEGGVMFIGLHLVGGRMDDKDAWKLRHLNNADFIKDLFDQVDRAAYRAVVILGNSRPSKQQAEFWDVAVEEIREMGKPTIYIHANSGYDNSLEMYTPFKGVDNLKALDTLNGNVFSPVYVNVHYGKTPFTVRDPQP